MSQHYMNIGLIRLREISKIVILTSVETLEFAWSVPLFQKLSQLIGPMRSKLMIGGKITQRKALLRSLAQLR